MRSLIVRVLLSIFMDIKPIYATAWYDVCVARSLWVGVWMCGHPEWPVRPGGDGDQGFNGTVEKGGYYWLWWVKLSAYLPSTLNGRVGTDRERDETWAESLWPAQWYPLITLPSTEGWKQCFFASPKCEGYFKGCVCVCERDFSICCCAHRGKRTHLSVILRGIVSNDQMFILLLKIIP